jgi:hypothetical protein
VSAPTEEKTGRAKENCDGPEGVSYKFTEKGMRIFIVGFSAKVEVTKFSH